MAVLVAPEAHGRGRRARRVRRTAHDAALARRCRVDRLRLAAVCLVITLLVFTQSSGLVAADTKFDLVVTPWRFLVAAVSAWDPTSDAGTLQNQSYGYLFPMGPFFVLGHLMHLTPWVIQRSWESAAPDRRVPRRLPAVAAAGHRGLVAAGRRRPRLRPCPADADGDRHHLLRAAPGGGGAVGADPARPRLPRPTAVRPGGRPRCPASRCCSPAAPTPPRRWRSCRSRSCGCSPAQRGPRRAALMRWWALAVGLACLWWTVPLIVLGKYSPPFLNWIESAAVTTSPTSLATTLRGTEHWEAYLGQRGVAGRLHLRDPAHRDLRHCRGRGRRDHRHRAAPGSAPAVPRQLPRDRPGADHRSDTSGSVGPLFARPSGPHSTGRSTPSATCTSSTRWCGCRSRSVSARSSPPASPDGAGVAARPPRRGARWEVDPRVTGAVAGVCIAVAAVAPAVTGTLFPELHTVNEPTWWSPDRELARPAGRAAGRSSCRAPPSRSTSGAARATTRSSRSQPHPGRCATRSRSRSAGYIRLLDEIDAELAAGARRPDAVRRCWRGRAFATSSSATTSTRSRSGSTPLQFIYATLEQLRRLPPGRELRPEPGVRRQPRTDWSTAGRRPPGPAITVFENTGWTGDVGVAARLADGDGEWLGSTTCSDLTAAGRHPGPAGGLRAVVAAKAPASRR